MSIAAEKKFFRAEMRGRLKAMSPRARAGQSLEIVQLLLQILPREATVATFAPLPIEPELTALHAHFPSLAYPLIGPAPGEMQFYDVADPDSLQKGRWNLREPDPEQHQLLDPAGLDFILCPAFAFTKGGQRLGKGGGYYDRYLTRAPRAEPLGVAFHEQIVGSLPTEPHDLTVNKVISPLPPLP